jgi:flagellar biosynthetic protein FlhB
MSGDKRHNPSKRRLEKAKNEEGRYCKSSVITGCCVIVSIFLTLFHSASNFWLENKMLLEYRGSMLLLHTWDCARLLGQVVVSCCLVPLLVGALVAIGVEAAQACFRLPAPKLRMQLSKNFSLVLLWENMQQAFPKFGIALMWSFLFLGILFIYVFSLREEVLAILFLQYSGDLELLGEFFSLLPLAILFLLVTYAALDYALERRRFLKSLAMSDQDLRDEYKEREGDPNAKYARKMIWQEWAILDMERRIRRSRCVVVEKNHSLSQEAQRATGAGP